MYGGGTMKRKWLLLIGCLVSLCIVSSCKFGAAYSSYYQELGFDIPNIDGQFNTLEGVLSWVSYNIAYRYDNPYVNGGDYFQTPKETYDRRTGDCEDYSILTMYLAYTYANIELKAVIGTTPDGLSRHMWVSSKDGSTWWDPQYGIYMIVSSGPFDYHVTYTKIEYVSYAEIMYRCTGPKRSLGSVQK
jgi:Transglutaminase-like domain